VTGTVVGSVVVLVGMTGAVWVVFVVILWIVGVSMFVAVGEVMFVGVGWSWW